MEIAELIKHPERLDRDSLYELRSMLALYPYFQSVRLLLLQNLYLLHDPTFDEELRRAAIYITDRKVIFQMVEAAHYTLKGKPAEPEPIDVSPSPLDRDSRTLSLIDDFLDTIPKDDEQTAPKGRKPTPADASVDYVAYLLENENEEDRRLAAEAPQLIGQSLIDKFINDEKGKITLSDNPQRPQQDNEEQKEEKSDEEGVNTETMARIYIKQGNYSKALEIITQLSLDYPKKSIYFADQIRFLRKLIINNSKKTTTKETQQ
ncbi:MAG: tetratricopeptide repeat protein [Prevotella sp.]|nr:tetratricopeptide repeat protein [Prevotella sp.]